MRRKNTVHQLIFKIQPLQYANENGRSIINAYSDNHKKLPGLFYYKKITRGEFEYVQLYNTFELTHHIQYLIAICIPRSFQTSENETIRII